MNLSQLTFKENEIDSSHGFTIFFLKWNKTTQLLAETYFNMLFFLSFVQANLLKYSRIYQINDWAFITGCSA